MSKSFKDTRMMRGRTFRVFLGTILAPDEIPASLNSLPSFDVRLSSVIEIRERNSLSPA